MKIGESIAKYRKQSGLTQKQLADRLYLSVDIVSKWERGSRRPDYNTILMLSGIFGVPTESIIDINHMMMSELKRCIPENIASDDLPGLINAFVNDLSERDGNIFLLRYYYFEEIKSIAAMTDESETNIRVILFRTRSKLNKFLRRNNYE